VAKVLVEINGTKGTFKQGESVTVLLTFNGSGNYIIVSIDGKKRVYAHKDEIEL